MTGLREKGLAAIIWSFAERMGAQIILLINAIVLARLLNPTDFGIFAMLSIFINISTIFVDSGMGGGLVRKQDITDDDCTTFFYFNISAGFLMYFLLFIGAPFIAEFYKQDAVTNLLRVLGLSIIFNSFSLVNRIFLIRDLNFKTIAKCSLYSSIISVIISMAFAFKGFGVWSLVAMQLTQSILLSSLLIFFSKWKPNGIFSNRSFKELYSFGIGLFFSSLINTVFRSIYQPLIGKFFSPSYAGFYFQANKLFEVPILTLSSVIDSVAYPLLVKVQDDKVVLQMTYQKIFNFLLFISVPIVVLLSFLSKEIIEVLLGEKWMYSSVLLKIISFSGLFLILETANRSLFKIYGYTQLIFKLEIIKKALILIVIYFTYQWGMIAFMYGLVFNSILSFVLNQYFSPIRLKGYREIFLMLLMGISMAIIIYSISKKFDNDYGIIFFGGGISIVVYALLAFILRISSFNFLLDILRKKFKKTS